MDFKASFSTFKQLLETGECQGCDNERTHPTNSDRTSGNVSEY